MLKKLVLFPLIYLCVALAGLGCQEGSPRQDEAQFSNRQLQEVVDGYLSDQPNILGTIVKVDIQGKGSYEAASGYFDSSRTAPLTPDTPFLIGSITKVFTAVLVLQLVEKGEVDLQKPLIGYLSPEWAAVLGDIEYGPEITVEQALSHRSGLADMTDSEAFHRDLLLGPTKNWGPMDVVKMVQQKGEPKFRPGTNYDYCNTNYILLSGLIENVSGMSYRESLQKNILEPIGLANTSLVEGTFGSREERIAHGYSRVGEKLYDGHDVPLDWAAGAGGLISTADDLIKFDRALVSGSLFEREGTYRQMCELVGHNEAYGRGLEVFDDPDIGRHYGHEGNLLNTRAILAYFPEQQMTLSVCHTYDGFSLSSPRDLMKRVVQSIRGAHPTRDAGVEFEGPDLLANVSDVVQNEDEPARGDWHFDLKEEWRLTGTGVQIFSTLTSLRVGEDGRLYLLDRGLGDIAVLDPDGAPLVSFGGRGDGPRFEDPYRLYVTPRYVHVLDIGRTGDKIKTYDKKGSYIGAYEVERGVSPRLFVNDEQFLAVRSGPDVLNRPKNELLELLSLESKEPTVLGRFAAEEKLILETMVPMGRFIFLQDDIEIFPRLIAHSKNDMLYVGRSDKYLIARMDLEDRERRAFSIAGRERKALPAKYAVEQADTTRIAGHEMPQEMRERFLARFPDRQTYYTKITSDDQGLIYVFVPDVVEVEKQRIDIFSREGEYLYRAVIELPDGRVKARSIVFEGDHLYALVQREQGGQELVKYKVNRPVPAG
jgi:D-alanyl-D-alanine carboxypeptidase